MRGQQDCPPEEAAGASVPVLLRTPAGAVSPQQLSPAGPTPGSASRCPAGLPLQESSGASRKGCKAVFSICSLISSKVSTNAQFIEMRGLFTFNFLLNGCVFPTASTVLHSKTIPSSRREQVSGQHPIDHRPDRVLARVLGAGPQGSGPSPPYLGS